MYDYSSSEESLCSFQRKYNFPIFMAFVFGLVHAMPEEFENLLNHRSFWICLRKTLTGKSLDYRVIIVSGKLSKCFPSTRKHKAGVFQSSGLKRVLKTPSSWRISVNGRPNQRNKAAFSNFSGIVPYGSWIWWPVCLLAHILNCRCVPLCLFSRMRSFYSHHLLKLCGSNDQVEIKLFHSMGSTFLAWMTFSSGFVLSYSAEESAN